MLIFFFALWVAELRITAPEQAMTILPMIYYTSSPLINVMHFALVALLLFILLGGLPILLAACWRAIRERRFRALALCLLGLVSPLCMIVLMVVALIVFEVTKLPRGTYTSVVLCLFFIGIGLSLALIIFAVQQVAPSRRITRYMFSLALVIPVIMLIGLAALLLGAVPVIQYAFAAGEVLFVVRQVVLILVMLAAFVFALFSLSKGFQATLEKQAGL